MTYKRQSIKESLGYQAALYLFDIAILATGLLSEANKEAVYQETAMRMLATMPFAPSPEDTLDR